ncbi:hypothetical protein CBM2599_A180125 [Cupriavidus taiwanensis]|uniref:Uncharacterized protein n=1 Tax=Cupriavidus taiwanensis TaxID=164546 RepID=A0A976AIN8_9BURK|nr:hypothetical protein CBM2599_A180125 [Cupriavidus taiwanensis]SOY86920.1 hypothetical protein CBM2600_A160127 [Cupriavidus taiwanensis]SPD66013.1 protein of unknown function [Cupriavidus taiwanensis]
MFAHPPACSGPIHAGAGHPGTLCSPFPGGRPLKEPDPPQTIGHESH